MSKGAKIILSKSILDVKKWSNFFKKKLSKNINLGDHYLLKTFFSKLNFWTTLLSKITPSFWQTFITRRNFLKIFPWWHVDSWPKSLLLRTHPLWNSTTELILMYSKVKVFWPGPKIRRNIFLSFDLVASNLRWRLGQVLWPF